MNHEMLSLLSMMLTIIAMALTIRANVLIRRAAEELERAILAMESDSSDRSSARALPSASLTASQASTVCQSKLWKWFCSLSRRASKAPSDSRCATKLSPNDGTATVSSNKELTGPRSGSGSAGR